MPSSKHVQPHVHIVGAGLAGLSCAVSLLCRAKAPRVTIYEAAKQAGGRCRSFHDTQLNRQIDNGNHLILSGNRAALKYLKETSAADTVEIAPTARFPFMDVRTGARWTVDMGAGHTPGWLLDPARRVAGTGIGDYAPALGLIWPGTGGSLAAKIGNGVLYERFWEPMSLAILNLPPEKADAGLMRRVLAETVVKGGAETRPVFMNTGLSDSFVAPALRFILGRGGAVQMPRRLSAIDREGSSVILRFRDGDVVLGAQDRLVLAVPPTTAQNLISDLTVPEEGEPIVNLHYRTDGLDLSDKEPMLGLIGATAQWIFRRGDVVSVTISGGSVVDKLDDTQLAATVWAEIVAALDLPAGTGQPVSRVIRERRATFIQTPENVLKRPKPDAAGPQIVLAGDWTDTGLPCTIEGSIRSGETASQYVTRGM